MFQETNTPAIAHTPDAVEFPFRNGVSLRHVNSPLISIESTEKFIWIPALRFELMAQIYDKVRTRTFCMAEFKNETPSRQVQIRKILYNLVYLGLAMRTMELKTMPHSSSKYPVAWYKLQMRLEDLLELYDRDDCARTTPLIMKYHAANRLLGVADGLTGEDILNGWHTTTRRDLTCMVLRDERIFRVKRKRPTAGKTVYTLTRAGRAFVERHSAITKFFKELDPDLARMTRQRWNRVPKSTVIINRVE